MRPVLAGLVALSTLSLALPGSVVAAPMLVTSSGGIQADGTISWPGSPGGTLSKPINLAPGSISGLPMLGATVGAPNAGTMLDRFVQGMGPGGFNGDFTAGDQLLGTGPVAFTFGPFVIEFSEPVNGVGVELQPSSALVSSHFAIIQAFDEMNTQIASFSVMVGNNTTTFIGVLDTIASISRIEVGAYSSPVADSTTARGTIINGPIIQLDPIDPGGTQVPEPASLAVWSIAGVGLAFARRKQFRKQRIAG